MDHIAYLGNAGEYTSFTSDGRKIRFLTGKNLIRYTRIKEWDHGYLVVGCENRTDPGGEEEDYIDLIPILHHLLIDPDRFLDPIREVKMKNSGCDEEERRTSDATGGMLREFAFSRVEAGIRIVHQCSDGGVMIITPAGRVLESSMTPIEEAMAKEIWEQKQK